MRPEHVGCKKAHDPRQRPKRIFSSHSPSYSLQFRKITELHSAGARTYELIVVVVIFLPSHAG